MNKQRAQEIAASPVMANVTYEGVPIYIQHVDEERETARVYPLDQPEQEQEVPLNSLTEG
ncbi:small acid-soluble spore protein H [Paenibacillus ehimensis]|uniref:Small acid-soluble spore protein H n=1 Tax=Paenibacillus ehimensis TaxID=79264 RepID=A0ABT8VEX6_9BACL|nr:small acid-soluble spore protein H [Paenibacillus ehimensis]MDO3679524.1 small acid-soluble spore protein H [Paenibacillus ehimensis]MEC0208565.1 small acid-soluble spore protein H [Paenibacillus ehimensis]